MGTDWKFDLGGQGFGSFVFVRGPTGGGTVAGALLRPPSVPLVGSGPERLFDTADDGIDPAGRSPVTGAEDDLPNGLLSALCVADGRGAEEALVTAAGFGTFVFVRGPTGGGTVAGRCCAHHLFRWLGVDRSGCLTLRTTGLTPRGVPPSQARRMTFQTDCSAHSA
jgi:hypothetical protein